MKKIILFSLTACILLLAGCTNKNSDAERNTTADYQVYRNDILGIQFTYPKSLGDLDLTVYDTQITGKFSNGPSNPSIGGITKNFSAERSSYYMDFSGFKKEDDKYLWESVDDHTALITPKVVVNDNIILVDCMSFEDKCKPTGPSVSIPEGYSAGLVNLKRSGLPGLILIADGNIISEKALLGILSSLEFVN